MSADRIEQIAVVTGSIVHRGTALPFDGSITFEVNGVPVPGRVLGDGTFVVSGRPDVLFPGLDTAPVVVELRIRTHSSELTTGSTTHSIPIALAQGEAFAAPIDAGRLELPADPADVLENLARTVRGAVRERKDPRLPVAGATIDIVNGSGATDTAVTDAEGRFTFDDLVVFAPAEIRCAAAGFTTQTRELSIDFHRSMHEEHFHLVIEPPP